ncbi:hypothetical protein JCM10914A_15560 [Paenibacillus sp. JCM 10914]
MSEQSAKKVAKKDPKSSSKNASSSASGWKIALWIMIPFFLVAALLGGLIFGYVVLGRQELDEVFRWGTWKHVFDLIFAP